MNMQEYFEGGCLCVLTGRIEKYDAKLCTDTVDNYYLEKCTCSRHPDVDQNGRDYWDRDKKLRQEALKQISEIDKV